MSNDPGQRIEELAASYRRLSDAQFLDELSRLPTLPADTAGEWIDDESWDLGYRHVALASVAAERRLRAAVVPLLQRASLGDPGELMRGLRHDLEAIAKPDWEFLAGAYVTAAADPRAGSRRWSIAGLGVLRDPKTMPTLVAALRDSVTDVREAACQALFMLCQEHAELRTQAVQALSQYTSDPKIGLAAKQAVEAILKTR